MPTEKSCGLKFIQAIDVFSYIPVPQAYPVSTKKSKIGSIIFIFAILGYLIYDFYSFVTSNVSIINAYETDIINSGPSPVPRIAFGMYFKNQVNSTSSTSYMFNNSAYFTYKFQSYLTTLYPNKTSTQVAVSIPLIPCQNDKINNWTSGWYDNLTCVDVNSSLIPSYNLSYQLVNQQGYLLVDDQVIDQVAYSYYLRLLIYSCKNSTSNVTCANSTDINNVLKNSTLYFLGLQPARYDFKAGKPLGLTSAVTYKYTVKANTTTTSSLYVYPTQMQMYPNLLTQFTLQTKRYSRYARDYTTTSSTASSYDYRVRIWPEWAMNIVQNHPTTLIQKLSEWSAFIGLILFIGGICFLTYNKNKFAKKNPDWDNFDETMQQKVYVQLQTIQSKTKKEQQLQSQRQQSNLEDNGANNGDSYLENSENIDDSNNITNIRKKIMEQQSYKDK